ncbi:MAG: metallophosphoesterase family protein [Bryobacteraceae bacterium]|nr:metallophosphoesterase family protein [Bryobacteraceae bacterium]
MRFLIVSDIHSNVHALEAVLYAAEGEYDQALCLGDLVGYCADPNPVVEWARRSLRAIVRGNHDKACVGLEGLEWFNPVARAAALWTMRVLSPENTTYLRDLPMGPIALDQFQILHGSPLDEDEYLVNALDAMQLDGYLDKNVSFFGHTHLQGGFAFRRRGLERLPRMTPKDTETALYLDPDAVYLINPGSVGQPRDGDPRAAFALYYPHQNAVIFKRVSYDVEAAQKNIRQAGLPDALARRLKLGQ